MDNEDYDYNSVTGEYSSPIYNDKTTKKAIKKILKDKRLDEKIKDNIKDILNGKKPDEKMKGIIRDILNSKNLGD